MANKTFRWGVLGPGRIAQQFTEDAGVVKHAEVFAVASTNPSRARGLCP